MATIRFTFYPSKQGASLLTSLKPTTMTKMAGVTPAKITVFQKHRFHHPDFQKFLYAPLLYTPPTPRMVFSGSGGFV